MADKEAPSPGAGNTPARHEDPSIDEVFPLVTDLGQLLLDWSWEGTVGVEDKIDRTAKAYDHDAIVRGPAGSGRSTLLAQCHAVDPLPAWLSLETVDNDVVALWWSMITAMRAVIGDFGGAYQARLLGGSGAVDEVVVSVCNELAERDMPIHLFLDDLHVVDDETCRRSLHRFVSSVPDGVRVTVASRRSEPLPLGRLRANGDLVEFGASDLALSVQESNQLLSSFEPSLGRAYRDVLVARSTAVVRLTSTRGCDDCWAMTICSLASSSSTSEPSGAEGVASSPGCHPGELGPVLLK